MNDSKPQSHGETEPRGKSPKSRNSDSPLAPFLDKKKPGKKAQDSPKAQLARKRRKLSIPRMVYDDELPVSARRKDVADAILNNQVVVLCGETGSGKSTQLPKICMELGFGVKKLIGHTQPRRIAAISIANRLAQELKMGTQLPIPTSEIPAENSEGFALIPPEKLVGYKIRFTDHTSPETCIKLMTDGILLAETQGDRFLNQYEVLIIDEAHERSLNIDFLIGVLRRLVDNRPDLKVIITSATIDATRFAAHFETPARHVPILQIEGRTYPVDVIYAPILDEEEDADDDDSNSAQNSKKAPKVIHDGDVQQAVIHAMDDLSVEGPGDMLVFMPTERDIHELVKLLHGEEERRQLSLFRKERVEILPLFARLPAEDQQKIFNPSGKTRRIVIATNVAESSVTVPGIRYCIDTGTARISRYSARTKTQRLPIEPISRASADQRKGRCGRLGPGICVRLYSEEDYNSREEYTQPEIQRTNLASVILQTKILKLGRIESFPFLDPPRTPAIRDGYKTLYELQALTVATCDGTLTPLGEKLARLPVDPRIGRMILAALDESNGTRPVENPLQAVLVIASALEIRDPRERPIEKQGAADAAHARFLDSRSDFYSLLKLWDFYQDLSRKLSRNQLMRACHQNFLSWNRMREWLDVYHQLRELVQDLIRDAKLPSGTLPKDDAPLVFDPQADPQAYEVRYRALHRALLTGLLSNLGQRSVDVPGEYNVGGGGKCFLWPGSGVLKGAKATKNPLGLKTPELEATQKAAVQNLHKKAGNRFWGRNLDANGQPEGVASPENHATSVSDKDAPKVPPPTWVMAAEMVETSKRFLRTLAIVDVEWVEGLAGHLVTKTHSEPHWSKQNNSAMVYEKVSLAGLVIVPKRRVPYSQINPAAARQMFIRRGLVEGNWESKAPFYRHNRKLWAELEQIQAKLRRHDYLPGDWKLYDFYDARIPLEVVDNTTMDKWLRALEQGTATGPNGQTGEETLKSLEMVESDIVDTPTTDDANALSEKFPDTFSGIFTLPSRPVQVAPKSKFRTSAAPEPVPADLSAVPELKLFGKVATPLKKNSSEPAKPAKVPQVVNAPQVAKTPEPQRVLSVSSYQFPLEYRFEPGGETDGVTILATLETVHQLNPQQLEWGIPGLLEERVAYLIKALPKEQRRKLIPAPDTARDVCSRIPFGSGSLRALLAHELTRQAGNLIHEHDLDFAQIPAALQMNIRVSDQEGRVLAESRDFQEILRRVGSQASEKFAMVEDTRWTRGGFTSWTFDDLPIRTEIESAQLGAAQRTGRIAAFPMLVDEGKSVGLRLSTSQFQAENNIRRAVLRLFRLAADHDLTHQALWLPKFNEMKIAAEPFVKSIRKPFQDLVCDLMAHIALDPDGFPELGDMPSLLIRVPRSKMEYDRIVKQARGRISIVVQELPAPLLALWKAYHAANKALNGLRARPATGAAPQRKPGDLFFMPTTSTRVNDRFQPVFDDISRQMERLMPPDFLLTTSWRYLRNYARYFQGMEMRIATLLNSNTGILQAATRGQEQMDELEHYYTEYAKLKKDNDLRGVESPELEEFRWMLEEYRISIFAQKLGTSVPVSSKRLEKYLKELG